MAVRLNGRTCKHAKQLIAEGKAVLDERDDWSEHRLTAAQENAFLEQHGFGAYARWYLGLDDENPDDTKAHYRFPYGDLENAHRCGLLSAEIRAARYKHLDVESAAAHLHGMLEQLAAQQRR
jgi:hypothetical protein